MLMNDPEEQRCHVNIFRRDILPCCIISSPFVVLAGRVDIDSCEKQRQLSLFSEAVDEHQNCWVPLSARVCFALIALRLRKNNKGGSYRPFLRTFAFKCIK